MREESGSGGGEIREWQWGVGRYESGRGRERRVVGEGGDTREW